MSPPEKSTRRRRRERIKAERQAITAAVHSLIAERGYAVLTLTALCQSADIDEAAFTRHFDGLEQCCVDLWEEGVQEFLKLTTAAFFAAPSWRGGMRAAAWAYCAFLQEDQHRSRFFIELAPENDLLEAKRDFIMDRWTDLVDQGRRQPGADPGVPRAQAEAIVGAIWERQAKAIRDGCFDRLPELIPEGLYLTVLPYIGVGAAEEELRRGPADIAAYRATRAGLFVSPHGPDPDRVRLCRALVELVAEHGYRATTVAELVRHAGLTIAEFERHFTDRSECAERVWEEMSDAFIAGLRRASRPSAPWLERIRAAANFTLGYFEADVPRSTFFISLSTGELAQARRDLVVRSAIDLIDEGRQELEDPDSLDRATAENVAGTLYEAIVKALGRGDVRLGRTLLPELMYITVLPYCGLEVAEQQMLLAQTQLADS